MLCSGALDLELVYMRLLANCHKTDIGEILKIFPVHINASGREVEPLQDLCYLISGLRYVGQA